MLSYQHAYHAGNITDVLKHTIWSHILTHLLQKPNPVHVYETHAGRGLYPVDSAEMKKLEEYHYGLGKLTWSLDEPNPYLQTVAFYNPTGTLVQIPGSPAIAARLLRPEDHLYLAEAHAGEFEYLKSNIRRPNLHLHLSDGHGLMPRFIRSGNRTAVLIDPSYEIKNEYQQTVTTVSDILAANPQATVMIWYPLLAPGHHKTLITGLAHLKIPATWRMEYTWEEPQPGNKGWGMYGTGNIVLNMPYKLENTVEPMLKHLVPKFEDGKGRLLTHFLVARD